MTGRVAGKVALITGAGRGQGRSHALRLAEEGADIIAVDVCRDFETVGYSLASPADLQQTAKDVAALDRRVVAIQADVRRRDEMAHAVQKGIDELGRLDVVVANAGIAPLGAGIGPQAWFDAVAVNLVGVHNTFEACFPHLGPGASLIATGSTASLRPDAVDKPHNGPGGLGYRFAKKELARLVDNLAMVLGPHQIRVNGVHPTNVDTPMLHSGVMYRAFRPDLEDPSRDEAVASMRTMHPMPIPSIDPIDVSEAVLYLASDASRYVTGLQLRIDGGSLAGKMTK